MVTYIAGQVMIFLGSLILAVEFNRAPLFMGLYLLLAGLSLSLQDKAREK